MIEVINTPSNYLVMLIHHLVPSDSARNELVANLIESYDMLTPTQRDLFSNYLFESGTPSQRTAFAARMSPPGSPLEHSASMWLMS